MFDKLLPQRIDNTYRGYKLALWLFGLVVGVTIIQGVFVIFNGYSTIMGADGIPLNTYPWLIDKEERHYLLKAPKQAVKRTD